MRSFLRSDSLSQQNRLKLFAPQGGGRSLGDLAHIRDERGRLLLGVVLTEGNEVQMPPREQAADACGVCRKTVVGRDGEQNRSGVPQMGLAGQGDGRICNSGCELGEGIARARRDDKQIEALLRPDGLNGGQAV